MEELNKKFISSIKKLFFTKIQNEQFLKQILLDKTESRQNCLRFNMCD
jgi:hypothetical protein